MSYDEASHHVIHGMPVHCTDAQVRSIRVKLSKTPQFKRWHALESRARHIHITAADDIVMFNTLAKLSKDIAEALAESDYDMLCVLHDLIEEEVG